MKRILIYSIATVVALGSVSCVKEQLESLNGDKVTFAAYRQQVLTRADAEVFNFDEGTKYTLFAVKHASTEAGYLWNSGKGLYNQPQAGEETSSHTIGYTPMNIFPRDEELDFFGLTFGSTTTAPTLSNYTPTDGTTPVYVISETNDRLPDLMHSNTALQKTNADGVITLPFEHALSAITFRVSKQDESAYSKKQLKNVKITDIHLENVAETASMNLVTGVWTASSWTGTRTIYNNSTGITLSTEPQTVGDSDIIVVPNATDPNTNTGNNDIDSWVNVVVTIEGLRNADDTGLSNETLSGGWKVTNGKVTIKAPIRHETTQFSRQIVFERNHKYVFSIEVCRGNTRMIEIIPQVYEWQEVDLAANTTILGQPVTFGGVVWMDRNLGATSPDCDNDWWHSCGYFYQYGRNIPFIINVDGIYQRHEQPSDATTYYHGILNPSTGNEYADIWTAHDSDFNTFRFHVDNKYLKKDGTLRPWNDTGKDPGSDVIVRPPALYDPNTFDPATHTYYSGDTQVFLGDWAVKNQAATNPNLSSAARNKFHPGHNASGEGGRDTRLIYTIRYNNWITFQWEATKKYYYKRPGDAAIAGRTPAALNPGDDGAYQMIMGYGCTTTWAWKPQGPSADSPDPEPDPRVADYWWNGAAANGTGNNQNDGTLSTNDHLLASYPDNQPVPKGWRLPRRSDGYKILPEPAQSNRSWMEDAAYLFQGLTDELGEDVVNNAGSYRFQYVRGRITIDSEPADADGLTTVDHSATSYPCIYGIKYQGTDKAYRIRIRMMESSRYPGRHYLRIEQFPATASDVIRTDVEKTGLVNDTEYHYNGHTYDLAYDGTPIKKWNIQSFDWDHPSGHLDFPLQGYIDAGGDTPYWNQIGICTIMRLPEHQWGQEAGWNWTFYMRNATSGVAVGADSRRALGDCIRLVRDIN